MSRKSKPDDFKQCAVKPRVYPMPRTRDPIVNTLLLPLGFDRRGVERFWISTYNRCVGSIGLRVDEWGNCKAYRFPWQHEGFYSSVQTGDDVIWLCGRLDRLVRLNLKTGRYQAYETGVPKARVFEGMIYDEPTGKLFVLSQPHWSKNAIQPTAGVSFDIRARKTVRIHELAIAESVSRCSFPNGDGSYSLVVQIPGETLVRWDPRSEQVTWQVLSEKPVWSQGGGEKLTCRMIGDEHGRRYFPGRGWYQPQSREFESTGSRPEREATWLFREGDRVIGALNEGSDVSIQAWELATGRVQSLFKIPDCDVFNIQRTRSGRLVAVNGFGVFFRYDLKTLALESSRCLPVENTGDAMTLCRIAPDRIIGVPYISSRFWELNLKTGKGLDCGRAQAAWGQIDLIEKVGDRIYLAAYAGGELLEADPARPFNFPENPRVVADPPQGMRPVAMAQDGRVVYYSCANEYGQLGSVLTRYDSRTGRATYAVNPLPDQQIHSLVYDSVGRSLIGGTTYHADSMSCTPAQDRCCLVQLDAATLRVRQQVALPQGPAMVTVVGPLDANRWVCGLHAHSSGPMTRWLVLERKAFESVSGRGDVFPAECTGELRYAGSPGRFLRQIEDRLELWDLRRLKRLKILFQPFDPARVDGYAYVVLGRSLAILRSRELILLENCLPR